MKQKDKVFIKCKEALKIIDDILIQPEKNILKKIL